MKTYITIKSDLSAIKNRYSKANLKRVQDAFGEQVTNDMFPFVPMGQTKNLSKGRYNRSTGTVDYNVPYARRQFRGGVGWHYTTPGTGPRWDLKAKSRYGKSWRTFVAAQLKHN
nr:MAG TPA: Minor capsid protein [Caudoviricetes sp.]